jgi:hypothetical protein
MLRDVCRLDLETAISAAHRASVAMLEAAARVQARAGRPIGGTSPCLPDRVLA